MLISVLVPTLNRIEYLKLTLDAILPQVERNRDKVEIFISINASEDKSADYVYSLSNKYSFLNFKNFEERVGICESFSRSIQFCSGKYIMIFGDDDIPAENLISVILNKIDENKNLGILHFNRLVASNLSEKKMDKMRLENKMYDFEEKKLLISDFVKEYNVSPGFISSMVFIKKSWDLGTYVDNSTHYGYDFLSRIYGGIHKIDNSYCLYLSYPLVIQRMVKHREWNTVWPKYWLLGVPNLLKSMSENGISKDALSVWFNSLNNSILKYIYILLWASSSKQDYIKEINNIQKYQPNFFRKFLAFFIIRFAPKSLFKIIRKRLYARG